MTPRTTESGSFSPLDWSLDAGAVTATALITAVVAYHNRHDGDSAAVTVASSAVALSYVVAGVIARHRPGRDRLALPMVLAGLTWSLPDLLSAMGSPDWLVFASVFVFDVFLVILLLTYPAGRVRTTTERWTVRGSVIVLVVFHTLLYPLHSTAVFEVLVVVESALQLILCVTVAVLLFGRWRHSSAAVRRTLAPLWGAGVLAAFSFVPLATLRPLTNLAVQGKLSASTSSYVLRVFFDADNGATFVQLLIPLCFLVGLLRASGARAAVADLIVELESAREPAQVRAAIARALGDPSLQIVYWLDDESADGSATAKRFVNADGVPAALEWIGPAEAVTEVAGTEGPLAALVHDRELLAQPALLRSVVAAARLALDNTRLQALLRAQLAQVRQSRARIVAAGLEERRRVERDLHDGAQQRLLALGLTVSMMRDRLADAPAVDPQLTRLADQAAGEVRASITELRELARGIHPAVLTAQGLGAAITSLTHRYPIPVRIDIPAKRWSTVTETTAYFVISEALANVTKHAHARLVTVRVGENHGCLRVDVCDDGIGGMTTAAPGPTGAGSGGLPGLADRVAALGGSFQVLSRPAEGTMVRVDLPCG